MLWGCCWVLRRRRAASCRAARDTVPPEHAGPLLIGAVALAKRMRACWRTRF